MAEEKIATVKAKSLAKAFLATKPEEEKAVVQEPRKKVVAKEKKPVVKAAEIAAVARMRELSAGAKEAEKATVEVKKESMTEGNRTPFVFKTNNLTEGGVVKKIPACKMAVPRKMPVEEMLVIAAKRKAAAKRIPVPMEAPKKEAPKAEVVAETKAAEVKEEKVAVAEVAVKEVKEAPKKAAPKAEPKKTAPKAAEKKAPAKKEAPKATPKKEVPAKKEAPKAAPKKEAPAKRVAPKAAEKKEAALVQNTYIEFASVQYHEATITKMAEQVWTKDMKKKLSDLKSMELYIKPEEKKVYYVFNKKETGDFDL